jgi:hypothetical protein
MNLGDWSFNFTFWRSFLFTTKLDQFRIFRSTITWIHYDTQCTFNWIFLLSLSFTAEDACCNLCLWRVIFCSLLSYLFNRWNTHFQEWSMHVCWHCIRCECKINLKILRLLLAFYVCKKLSLITKQVDSSSKLLACFQKGLVQILARTLTVLSNAFCSFLGLPGKCHYNTSFRPWLLPSPSFAIHY